MSVASGGDVQAEGPKADQSANAHAFGALATRLNEAVRQARQALAPHAGLLPDGTVADLDALLAEFARRRVRIAIYGEVKAGKSTLLNAIAGAALSPVAFDPLTSIPVRVTYGPDTTWRIGDRHLHSVGELERVMRTGAGDGDTTHGPEVVVETNLDLLELGGQVDLLDTPGVGSAPQFDALSAEVLRTLDAVVLVVRYPALFTQFTRRLMDGLQADIGKLFVVWNLDADCAELSPDERTQHAETLRTNVAGAHELFLVDARAAFRAMQGDDAGGSVASGLTTLIASLRRFASSGGRQVAALRETAKRTQHSLAAAQRCLTERQATLESALADTRARQQEVRTAADAASAAARGRLAEFEARVARVGQRAGSDTASFAGDLRRQLRAARWGWVRAADFAGLAAAVTAAASHYADTARAANDATVQALQAEMAEFDTAASLAARDGAELGVAPLAPEERIARSTSGRAQGLRRALWGRWYLPGLATLERTGIDRECAAQARWLSATTEAVCAAAAATLAHRLAEITQQAEAETRRIRLETNFNANEAEFTQLSQDVPVITQQSAIVARMVQEARVLL